MKWSKKNKYALLLKEFTHSQTPNHNGTKGYPIMSMDNIGVLNEETNKYEFKETKCSIYGRKVKPCFTSDFVLHFPHIFKTVDSGFDIAHDQEDKSIKERFEIRIFKSKFDLDLKVAELFYVAAQINRLSIKESIIKLNLYSRQYLFNHSTNWKRI